MKKVLLNNLEYELVKENKNAFNADEMVAKVTDYFADYDYIFGDYSYDKLRLKGFCEKNNKLFKEINDINKLDEYIKNFCSHGCSYFLLKKVDKINKK